MSRRRESVIEIAFEAFSLLFQHVPPWLCIPVAAVLFIVPTWWFGRPEYLWGSFRPVGMVIGMAGALACLGGGFYAFLQRRRQSQFLREHVDVSWAKQLGWRDFEKHLASVYRQRGYVVEELGGKGPDGGVDLRLKKAGEVTLVQCKQWRAWKVGVKTIRELYGVLVSEGADKAVLITSGEFTQEAIRFAEGKPIELINDAKLVALLREFQRELRAHLAPRVASLPSPNSSEQPAVPRCPHCSTPMVLRTAKKGNHAGAQFWGCPHFPRCRGIRPYSAMGT